MAGLGAGPLQYLKPQTTPTGVTGYSGGTSPYSTGNAQQAGSMWETPTGDVQKQTWIQPTAPFGQAGGPGYWQVEGAGRSLAGQEFDFNKQRWTDVLSQMNQAMSGFGSSGGSGLGPAIAAPALPSTTPRPTWTPDNAVGSMAFARNKENLGRMTAAAERELGDTFGQRGLSGSGLEAKALASLRNESLKSLAEGEFRRADANEGRAFDMDKLAATIASGERAQTIGGLGNIYATQVSQRGQQANDPRLQILASLVSAIGGMY